VAVTDVGDGSGYLEAHSSAETASSQDRIAHRGQVSHV
jgi:hypothetical protein